MFFDRIKNFVQSNRGLYYIAALIKFSRNKEFRENVISIRENPCEIVIEKRGDLHRGELYYEINPVIKYEGFFAVFRRLLTALYFSDEIGAKPYVEFSKDFIYAEKQPINGVLNPFEYYFEPIKPILEKDIDYANAVVRFCSKHIKLIERLNSKDQLTYQVSEEYLQKLSGTFSKYIHLNSIISQYISNSQQHLNLTTKTLGVHCRGTDFNVGSKNHPIIVTVNEYFETIDRLLEKGHYDRIFLATDDSNRLQKFIEHYGDKLCYFDDVARTTGNEGVHFSNNTRDNHHYQLGAEVIRDVYTLAACDGLVASMSQVSICTRIAKRASGKYSDEIIIDKGVVLSGKGFKHK